MNSSEILFLVISLVIGIVIGYIIRQVIYMNKVSKERELARMRGESLPQQKLKICPEFVN